MAATDGFMFAFIHAWSRAVGERLRPARECGAGGGRAPPRMPAAAADAVALAAAASDVPASASFGVGGVSAAATAASAAAAVAVELALGAAVPVEAVDVPELPPSVFVHAPVSAARTSAEARRGEEMRSEEMRAVEHGRELTQKKDYDGSPWNERSWR